MWRFDDDERDADPDEPGRRPESGKRSWPLRALRILVLAVVTAIPGVPAIFFLMPLPRGADGITLCFPVIGPLQQFAEGLDPELDEIVHIHERVHASQCRRLGALDYARTYLQDEGMIALEAEAFCAEARTLALRGQSTDRWVSRVVETLYLEYPHDESLTYADVTRIVGAWCPPSTPPRTAHP
jgi:hypothetical protein